MVQKGPLAETIVRLHVGPTPSSLEAIPSLTGHTVAVQGKDAKRSTNALPSAEFTDPREMSSPNSAHTHLGRPTGRLYRSLGSSEMTMSERPELLHSVTMCVCLPGVDNGDLSFCDTPSE